MRALIWASLAALLAGPIAHAQQAGPTPGPGNAAPLAPLGDNAAPAQDWAVHGQSTFTWQGTPGFPAAYSGPNSLSSHPNARETTDATLFLGLRLWQGAEIWANPELDQGFGLATTVGVAGFPSGEAYKTGARDPYFRMQRLFVRQTVELGGERLAVDPDQNVLGGSTSANRIVITVGKFSVADIFDTNQYAHDPRSDFLNWSVIDAGSWDYAADAWGYTYGAAVEWYQDWWTIRAGLFDLSTVSNSQNLDPVFIHQSQANIELEERHTLFGAPGKLKLLFFLSRGELGTYMDALAQAHGGIPNVNAVASYRSKTGLSLNLEQKINDVVGVFARAGMSQGSVQAYDFTDIVNTLSGGARIDGAAWGRTADEIGLAFAVNGTSRQAKQYFNAGGLGVLVGDGALPRAGTEQIMESYYNYTIAEGIVASPDYQFINHPAYSIGRGPVSVFGLRLHAQF